jgi:hypothetical protein
MVRTTRDACCHLSFVSDISLTLNKSIKLLPKVLPDQTHPFAKHLWTPVFKPSPEYSEAPTAVGLGFEGVKRIINCTGADIIEFAVLNRFFENSKMFPGDVTSGNSIFWSMPHRTLDHSPSV